MEYCCISVLLYEDIFHYHGHLRWNYGWANPTYAGAFLATIEPAIWMAAALFSNKWRGKRTGGFQFVAELVFWFLLAHTYTRGSIVAAFCARAAWQAMQGELTAIKKWARYLLAPLACILATGLGGRFYDAVATGDLSVEHRFGFWAAGLRMLAASPWTGWGAGRISSAFPDWYEPPGHTEVGNSLVNSYLNLAVEHGLPVLCLVIFIAAGLVYGGMSAAKSIAKTGRSSPVLAASVAVWVAWLVASVFETLWGVPSLWIVPGAAACVVVGCRRTRQILGVRKIFECGLFALGSALLLFFSGKVREGRSQILVDRDENDTITLESRIHLPENKGQPAVDIWSDPLVLGNHGGRQLRLWMQQPGGPERLVVHAAFGHDPQPDQDNRILVLVGRRASLLQSLPRLPAAGVILVNPLQWSREGLARLHGLKAVIVIPEIDQTGTNDAVRNEAQALGVKVLLSSGMGLDLRAAWPEIMQPAIHSL